jgi:hypothetical protein
MSLHPDDVGACGVRYRWVGRAVLLHSFSEIWTKFGS